MRRPPLISVVITTYKQEKYIGRTIESVLSQGIGDLEVLVLDDCSPDATREVVAAYLEDERVQYLRHPENLGDKGNNALALKKGRGKYMVWLHGDDYLLPGHLQSYLNVMETHPECALIYSPCYWVDGNERVLRLARHPGHPDFDYAGGRNEVAELLAWDNYITPSSVMFRQSDLDKVETLDPGIKASDWDLFIRLAIQNPNFAYLNTPSTAYRITANQGSTSFYASTEPLKTHLHVLKLAFTSSAGKRLWEYKAEIGEHLERRVKAYRPEKIEYLVDELKMACDQLGSISAAEAISDMNLQPLVSVVVPTKDRPELLQDTLNSINEQKYRNWEVIVVNDGGMDVEAIVRALDRYKRFRYIRHESSKGLPTARNTGIRFSRGDILCYLDDDDTFRPQHLSTIINALAETRAPFVYTEAEYIHERVENGIRTEVGRGQPCSRIEYSKDRLHIANYIPVNTWAHRRELLDASERFDSTLNSFEDWDLLLRFSRLVDFVHIPELTVEVHMRESGPLGHMTQRERKDFPSLYRKLYERYPVDNPDVEAARERQLCSLEQGQQTRSESGDTSGTSQDKQHQWPVPASDATIGDRVGTDIAHPDGDDQDPKAAYRKWMEVHRLEERDIQRFTRRMMSGWTLQPSIHLVMTHVSGQEAALADTLDSLGKQLYGGWGLSVVSSAPCPDPVFEEMEMLEWHQVEDDLMDSVNAVIEASGADWLGLLEAGTILEPHMLYQHVEHLHQHPEWRLVYMDEDWIDDSGERYDPLFKPEFNLELQRAIPYMGKFILLERETLLAAGAYGRQTGAEIYDAVFRVIEQFGEQVVGHIPDVLIHRQDRFQLAQDQDLIAANRHASVAAHLKRCGINGEAKPGTLFGSCFVDYACDDKPPVEIIVPVSGKPETLEPFLDSLLSQTQYPHFRVRLLVRDTVEIPAALRTRDNIDVVSYPQSGIQWQEVLELVRKTDTEYLMLMSAGAIAIQPNWLERLVAHFQKPDVAVVAPRLVSSDKTVVGGGIITGAGSYSVGMGAFGGLALEDSGYMGRAQVAQELSAVSASCMLVRKSVFESVEGVSTSLRLAFYQAVDFCLRVSESGGKIVWTPHSTLMFIGDDQSELEAFDLDELVIRESEIICANSLAELANDPAYNPNLKLAGKRFSVDDSFSPPLPHSNDTLHRVVALGAGSIGSWKFRIQQPLKAMHGEGVASSLILPFSKDLVQMPSMAELKRLQVDSLLMHNAMHDPYMDAMEACKRVNQTFIVFGQDDLMYAMPPKNPFFKTIYKDVKKRVRRCLGIADRVIVTTQPLADELHSMADDIRVVPNYLDEVVWGGLRSRRGVSGKPRVGWAGAQQHLGDLELLEEVVRETADEVDWVFFGMCPDFLQSYAKEIHNPVTFGKYPQKLATLNLDLAVAPLEHNRFNECKSNLRLLEYGVLGWPVIASDIAPYREGPVCRVHNQARAWIKAIRERIHDMDATRQEGDVLRDWVRENWLLQQHLDDWLAALDPASDSLHRHRARGRAAGL